MKGKRYSEEQIIGILKNRKGVLRKGVRKGVKFIFDSFSEKVSDLFN